MESNPYPTYEDAARDYMAKCLALTEAPQEMTGIGAQGTGPVEAEVLMQRAKEIAEISAGMIRLAQGYLDSADPNTREGICCHFIVQSAVELLLGIEIFQNSEKTGTSSTAAARATWGAALAEAVSAAEKTLSVPVTQGLPETASYRGSESATISEAAAGLKLAIESTANNISHRVRELGGDIVCDLVSGTQWDEVIRGASLSEEDVSAAMGSIHKDVGGMVLMNVYRKVSALLDRDASAAARLKMREWLNELKQADGAGVFNALIHKSYQLDVLRKLIRVAESPVAPIESLSKASDLVKASSDKFILLIGRMRKLEDAIRLGKLIDIPEFRLFRIALQVSLLAALVHAGQTYINTIAAYSDYSPNP